MLLSGSQEKSLKIDKGKCRKSIATFKRYDENIKCKEVTAFERFHV
jgi:hypothetical protein